MKTWLIYKITNPLSGLAYIGQTCDLRRRVQKHRLGLTVECVDFSVEVLFDGIPSLAEANEMEKVFIDLHGTFSDGANKTRGGTKNTEYSEVSRAKMSASQKGKRHSVERCRKNSEVRKGDKHHYFGKRLSAEHRRKMSEAKRGRPLSAERRRNMSVAQRKRWREARTSRGQLFLFD